tara:strand:- start:222 stop:1418 length:1197 start_codon:yes stop_codon:yes gene_type:complete
MFSELSKTLTKTFEKNIKKKDGIFFTPQLTVKNILKQLTPYMNNCKEVLEPSCGSCEFVLELQKQYPTIKTTGIELNKTIYDNIKHLSTDNIDIIHNDYLNYKNNKKFDLIIGNPPYFVMKKNEVDKKYYEYFDGRPNIFILFIIKALTMLSTNGILAFVLPKSFLNCLYYNKTRQIINSKYKIIKIFECNERYIDTQQDTICLIIQNKHTSTNKKFILNKKDYTIFGTPVNIKKINCLYSESKTLYELGFAVSVGKVVWNQCKAILTDDKSKTRLIYSSDIKNNTLNLVEYKNPAKKNYIDKDGIDKPLLVINRGYGIGEYNFEYCLIEGGFQYLIENHLICVTYNGDIETELLIGLYKDIICSLKKSKTKQFIKYYFGNAAINTTEMCHLLPIYGL